MYGDIRCRDDLQHLLRNLAYDDVDIVAEPIAEEQVGSQVTWQFTLTAPDRLVVSDINVRVLSRHLPVGKRPADGVSSAAGGA